MGVADCEVHVYRAIVRGTKLHNSAYAFMIIFLTFYLCITCIHVCIVYTL